MTAILITPNHIVSDRLIMDTMNSRHVLASSKAHAVEHGSSTVAVVCAGTLSRKFTKKDAVGFLEMSGGYEGNIDNVEVPDFITVNDDTDTSAIYVVYRTRIIMYQYAYEKGGVNMEVGESFSPSSTIATAGGGRIAEALWVLGIPVDEIMGHVSLLDPWVSRDSDIINRKELSC